MKHCCEDKSEALVRLRTRQRRMLQIVLAVNAAMFLIEVAGGLLGKSTALLGDSLDMLGDAMVYGLSLYVLDRGLRWRARASLVKGVVMALFGLGVLVEAVWKCIRQVMPDPTAMSGIGALALAANVTCLVLLLRHREDDVNMRSAWICSRNDILANVAVIGAAGLVRVVGSWWPDALVGAGVAVLFLSSAVSVLREGLAVLRAEARHPHGVVRGSEA